MFAPLVGGTPAVAPKGGIILEIGDFILESTQVQIGQHVVIFEERYFSRATKFLSERQIDQDAEKDRKGNELIKDRRVQIPFRYGTYTYRGRALAIEELKLIVARIVREFNIYFGQEGDQPFKYNEQVESQKDFFLTIIEKIDLRFIPRVESRSKVGI